MFPVLSKDQLVGTRIVGAAGAIVSILKGTIVGAEMFPPLSIMVAVPIFVPSHRPTNVNDQLPELSTVPVRVIPHTTTLIVIPV